MASKFIVSHAGQEVGPYGEAEIKQMLLSNQLSPIDYLYDEEKKDWILLSDRFDLKAIAKEVGEPPQVPGKAKSALPKPAMYPPLATPVPMSASSVSTGAKKSTVSTSSESPTDTFHVDAPPPIDTSKASTPAPSAATTTPILSLSSPTPVTAPVVVNPVTTAQNAAPAVIVIAQPQPATPHTAKQSEPAQKVSFSGGVGTISLKQLRAGKVSIKLQGSGTDDLTLPVETVVNVEPGPAKTITWQAPDECRAGEEVEIAMVARDAFENITSAFTGELEFVCKGKTTERQKAGFVSGRASVKYKWTVAETLSLELTDSRNQSLTMPAAKALKVHAGPAARVILETPPNAVAGETMPVTIKAVDQYGNLATDYKGELNLDMVLDPSNTKAS